MGACCSTEEEPVEADDVPVEANEVGEERVDTAKVNLTIAEADAVKAKPGTETFISTVLKARAEAADNPEILADCCTRLQAHNRRLKEYVAIYDAATVDEAMNGGFLGMGCNDNKLIAALCTRTKSQLQRTRKAYRSKYDKDMRKEVNSETGGAYRKLMHFALAGREEYVADIIEHACERGLSGLFDGCDETALLEVFVTHTQEQLQAGKDKWEGRTDKHLVDYLKENLGRSYRHLNRLLNLLFMGDRVEGDETDEALAAEQVDAIKEECDKGWFEDFDESMIIEIIGKNTTAQNQLVAQEYEKAHSESLAKALKGKCGDRLFYALNALLLTKPNFLAMRLHDAMEGWFGDKDALTRLLGGLDGEKMMGVAEAYEQKYDQPLWSALREKLSDDDFLKAALTWIRALEEPSRGAEAFTEQELGDIEGDCEKLCEMLDWLLLEHESMLVFVAYLDVETVREATLGSGTNDTALIRALATRNKRSLARVNIGYREAYGEQLQLLIDRELLQEGSAKKNMWYAYLAKFLVVQEEQADSMILDLAMDGPTIDHTALVEFLCARHPRRVRAAKQRWEQSHDDSLVDKLSDNLSGDMARLALKMLKGKRDTDDAVDEALGRKQAHQLHDGDLDYIDVLCENNYKQNAFVSRAFEDSYDMSLRRAITQEYSGPVKNALLALLSGPADWYAAQLKAALTGVETNDKAVCRIIGAHDKEEMKAIAAAYDKKYGVRLKVAIASECSGNYKRLAVAWVDLIDQLEQPQKKIELPSKESVPDATASDGRAATNRVVDDDEISENDDAPDDDAPDITSALFKAKVAQWTAKYERYREMGKKAKADHYQHLLILYPPVKLGSELLRGYAEALAEEYKGGTQSAEDWTTMWLATVQDDKLEAAGVSREFFKGWMDTTESMVRERRVAITELRGRWGLAAPRAPLKKDHTLSSMPIPQAAAATPVATATGYPMATGYPNAVQQQVQVRQTTIAYPAVARPMVQMAQPALYGGMQVAAQPMMMQRPMVAAPMMMAPPVAMMQVAQPQIQIQVQAPVYGGTNMYTNMTTMYRAH